MPLRLCRLGVIPPPGMAHGNVIVETCEQSLFALPGSMMTSSPTTHALVPNWQAVLLATVALVCALAVLEIRSDPGPTFYGRDIETIPGLNSATEVFSEGGRYVLHDFSALVPGCNDCDAIEFQVNVGVHAENRTHDVFNRNVVNSAIVRFEWLCSAPVTFPLMHSLSGVTVSPALPPPRV